MFITPLPSRSQPLQVRPKQVIGECGRACERPSSRVNCPPHSTGPSCPRSNHNAVHVLSPATRSVGHDPADLGVQPRILQVRSDKSSARRLPRISGPVQLRRLSHRPRGRKDRPGEQLRLKKRRPALGPGVGGGVAKLLLLLSAIQVTKLLAVPCFRLVEHRIALRSCPQHWRT